MSFISRSIDCDVEINPYFVSWKGMLSLLLSLMMEYVSWPPSPRSGSVALMKPIGKSTFWFS
uniref:Uncharacterized protein n=1 Tax=Octopus bimaculoides TaxID=37653 RepID=A0A0L8I0Z3_OCTBM